MDTEGEDMNDATLHLGQEVPTARSLLPPFPCLWFRCLNLDLVCPKESLFLPHKATLQGSHCTSCALSKIHTFVSWAVKS